MINYALRYFQDEHEFYSTVLSLKQVIHSAKPQIYKKNGELGYQRTLNELHYIKIKNSIIKRKADDISTLVSPTSIVIGIDRKRIGELNLLEIENDLFKLDFDESKELFRVIDGQHRLEGFKLALDSNPELIEYKFNVIIMIIEEGKKRVEVNMFSDINSKAKPLKMDLTLLAKYNYDLLEQAENIDISEHIAIRIAYKLNEMDTGNNVWRNGIKIDINDPTSPGIVGFKSFFESVRPICINVDKILGKSLDSNSSYDIKIKYIDEVSELLVSQVFSPFWVKVSNNWGKAFKESKYHHNYDYLNIIYDTNYYIQKTMGVKALHIILKECLEENDYNLTTAFMAINNIFNKTSIDTTDWEVGGRFSGLSSESGFKKISRIIKGEE